MKKIKQFFSDVLTKEEIDHKNRLGGWVRNPDTNELQEYNEKHPLWYNENKLKE